MEANSKYGGSWKSPVRTKSNLQLLQDAAFLVYGDVTMMELAPSTFLQHGNHVESTVIVWAEKSLRHYWDDPIRIPSDFSSPVSCVWSFPHLVNACSMGSMGYGSVQFEWDTFNKSTKHGDKVNGARVTFMSCPVMRLNVFGNVGWTYGSHKHVYIFYGADYFIIRMLEQFIDALDYVHSCVRNYCYEPLHCMCTVFVGGNGSLTFSFAILRNADVFVSDLTCSRIFAREDETVC